MNAGDLGIFANISKDLFSTEVTFVARDASINLSLSSTAISTTTAATAAVLTATGASNKLKTADDLYRWPDWTSARAQLKWTWMVHTYGFACVFFMLSFYAFFSVLNLRAHLSKRPYMSSINVFLCVLGASRTICFLVDPYQSKRIMPKTFGSILWELAFPSLISGFALIQLAFLQLTRLRLGPAKLRSKTCMSLAITFHFITTIAINIFFTYRNDIKVLRIVCQTAFLLWSAFLCLAFMHGGIHTMRLLKAAPNSMFPASDSSGFENKVMALGILANCPSMAMMTATAAIAPSFFAAPRISITDVNEHTYNYISDGTDATDGRRGRGHRGTSKALQQSQGLGRSPAKRGNQHDVCNLNQSAENDVADTNESSAGMLNVAIHQDGVSPKVKKNRKLSNDKVKTIDGSCNAHVASRKSRGSNSLAVENDASVKRNSKDSGSQASNGNLVPKSIVETKEGMEMSTISSPLAAQYDDFKQDVTLMSILNHIAYVNRAADDYSYDARKLRPKTRKGQIEKVLQGTYASAVLGFLLCLLEAFRIYGPYGLLVSTGTSTSSSSAAAASSSSSSSSSSNNIARPDPWPWFIFETICRIIELTMGCFMANITKQPVNRHQYPYSYHMKHRGGGLYF